MSSTQTAIPFPSLTAAQLKDIERNSDIIRAIDTERRRRKIDAFFRDSGQFRRELYLKQCSFFTAGGMHSPMPECPPDCDGSPHRERLFLAANRTGKTTAAAYEITLHCTGQYPLWWRGRRFSEPVLCWVCNDRHKNTRDINQLELFGRFEDPGTGMIPADLIDSYTTKSQPPKSLDTLTVKHISGRNSLILFKAYEQGWEAFTGAACHVVWCDEEPPEDVYAECLMRVLTTNGSVMLTFTPLQGMTPLVKGFIDTLSEVH